MCSSVVSALIIKFKGLNLPKACHCTCHNTNEAPLLPNPVETDGCQNCQETEHLKKEDGALKEDDENSVSCCRPDCFFRINHSSKKTTHLMREDEDTIKTISMESNCFPPEIIQFAEELLASAPRTSPYLPCVVGHIRRSTNSSTAVDHGLIQKNKNAEGPFLLVYNAKSQNFSSLVQLSKVHEGPVEASGYKVCAAGKYVYIFGGEYMYGYSNWQNSVWRWDSFKNFWNIETSLLSPRRHHSLCVHNEFIYLIGGYGKHRIILDSVDRYDTYSCTWKRCASLPSPTYSSACCSYNDMIYVFSQQLFAYNPESDNDGWQIITDVIMPSDTSFSQALSVENAGIYLTSMYSNVLYFFDPMSSALQLEIVGTFKDTVLNSCYVESLNSIVTFSTIETSSTNGSSSRHRLEVFDLKTNRFSVLWEESSTDSFITDFGIRHSSGCFPFLQY